MPFIFDGEVRTVFPIIKDDMVVGGYPPTLYDKTLKLSLEVRPLLTYSYVVIDQKPDPQIHIEILVSQNGNVAVNVWVKEKVGNTTVAIGI